MHINLPVGQCSFVLTLVKSKREQLFTNASQGYENPLSCLQPDTSLRYNRYIADQNRLALAGAICSSLRAAKDITEEHPLS